MQLTVMAKPVLNRLCALTNLFHFAERENASNTIIYVCRVPVCQQSSPHKKMKYPHLCNALCLFSPPSSFFAVPFYFALSFSQRVEHPHLYALCTHIEPTIFFQFHSQQLCIYKKACQLGTICPVGHDYLTKTRAKLFNV